jgi:hypothetical protein
MILKTETPLFKILGKESPGAVFSKSAFTSFFKQPTFPKGRKIPLFFEQNFELL